MNFLAHLLLTRPTADGWAGSLLPDLLRGAERRRWLRGDDVLAEAAAMHRRIDRLTDCHWSHQYCSALFRPQLGKPVVV